MDAALNFCFSIAAGELIGAGLAALRGISWLSRLEKTNKIVETVNTTVNGFKLHGVNQAITRGFKIADILKIIREGKAVQAMGRYGQQIRYTLGKNTVIVNTKGEIISVYSDAIGTTKGLGRGNFIPF